METLIKKAYELGECDGMDVALIICKHDRYTTYRSSDHASWPPSIVEMVSRAIACLTFMTSADLGHSVSSPQENVARTCRAASF